MSPEPLDPPGPHGPGQALALPSQGYQVLTHVASFNIFFDVFCAQQLKCEVKSHSPICIRFEHGSTTSLPAGIEAVICMATKSTCPFYYLFLQLLDFLLKFLASASTMQPRDEMGWTGQASLEANSCDEQQVYRIRQSAMFFKQCQQAMSSSFSTFSIHLRNLSSLEVEEQAAPAAPSSHLCQTSTCLNHICTVKFHLKPIHVMSNKLLTLFPFC